MTALKLLIGITGIYAAFLYYGTLQEKVLSFRSGNGEKFQWVWALQVIEALGNVVFGFACMCAFEGGARKGVPQIPYLISGAVQVSAKYFTNYSMVCGVSFPVTTLAKSSKMVPVMVGQLLFGKASYTVREYCHVIAIVAGTALVSMGSQKSGGSKADKGSSYLGLAFLILALVCDGVVGGTQKRLKHALGEKGMKEKSFEMQFLTNLYMCLTAVVFAVLMNEFIPAYYFIMANPAIFWGVVNFAVCSAIGQGFIFFVISEFDPLVCTTVTTTRKVMSVLSSIFLYGHKLSAMGWFGIVLACGGIMAELEEKFTKGRKKAKAAAAAAAQALNEPANVELPAGRV